MPKSLETFNSDVPNFKPFIYETFQGFNRFNLINFEKIFERVFVREIS